MPWPQQPPGLGRGLGAQAARGSAERFPACSGGKHELRLGERERLGKTASGMEREKPISEIQQLK